MGGVSSDDGYGGRSGCYKGQTGLFSLSEIDFNLPNIWFSGTKFLIKIYSRIDMRRQDIYKYIFGEDSCKVYKILVSESYGGYSRYG